MATPRHELTQRQLRGLLVLLVLLPLSPTVLMFRSMVEAVRAEHAAAEDRLGDFYRQALDTATRSLKNHLKTETAGRPATPAEVFDFYRRALDLAVRVRVVDASGRVLAGDAGDEGALGKLITEDTIEDILPRGRVQLYAASRFPMEVVDEQVNTYGWAVGVVVLINVAVSGVAAVALHRQSRLREMRNTALATVAHELKTPLASMRVLTDTLLDGAGGGSNGAGGAPNGALDPERTRTYVRRIAAENDRLIRITDNFLTLSRFEANGAMEGRVEMEPAALAREAVAAMESRYKEAGLALKMSVRESAALVSVNRESMVVVLVNLLDNALKFSRECGEVELYVSADGDMVEYCVEDHGVGIAKEAQKLVFDRFFQVDQALARTSEGCGLGLHIAKSIVEAHGGTIRMESTPGEGSTFTIRLPAVKTGAARTI